MTMHAEFFKENEGIMHNPVGQMPSDSVRCWSGLGSQLGYGEYVGPFKSSSLEHSANGSQLTATKQAKRGTEQGLEKGNTIQFSIFPDNSKKTSASGKKTSGLQEAISTHSAPSEYQGCFEIGFGQPVICKKYPYADQCYGVLSTYGHQITGRIMLPWNLTTDDGPIFVNAKQYHGIIRRRLARAKAGAENKVFRARKPYLHLSRHLHAMRRPRGCGGRFLNSKASNSGKYGAETEKTGNGLRFQPIESQNSEVLQSESVNLNSPNGSIANLLGSEVTSSIFSTRNFNQHAFNHLHASANCVSHMLKWAVTDHSRCNPKTCQQRKGRIGVELLAPPRS